jgi:hypothetical protein
MHGPVSTMIAPLKKAEIAAKSEPLLDTDKTRTADRAARHAAIAASGKNTQF